MTGTFTVLFSVIIYYMKLLYVRTYSRLKQSKILIFFFFSFFIYSTVPVPVRYGRNSTNCVWLYWCATKFYVNKNITKVWKHGIFYADTFILLLTYQNPKYSPVCGVCRVFFIRIIDVYVLWIYHNIWCIRTLLRVIYDPTHIQKIPAL